MRTPSSTLSWEFKCNIQGSVEFSDKQIINSDQGILFRPGQEKLDTNSPVKPCINQGKSQFTIWLEEFWWVTRSYLCI